MPAMIRRLDWSAALRGLHADRAAVPAGLITARTRCESWGRFNRPLFTAGAFDRSAIMAAAVIAAKCHQERFGCSWGQAMSIGLQAAWQAAKLAKIRSAH